jgi:hypothetical protein
MCIASTFLPEKLEQLKKQKDSIENILTIEEQKLYNEIIEANLQRHDYDDILNEIKELSKKNNLEKKSITINEFIDEYVSFIKQHNKEPDITSNDLLESELAKKYEIVLSCIEIDEKRDMLKIFKKLLEEINKNNFFNIFVEFVEKNKRFPSILGETKEEKSLANDYQKYGQTLPANQKKYIMELNKKYQANTVQYFMKRKG